MSAAENNVTTRITLQRLWPWAAIAALIIFVCVVRIQRAGVALERDEGEYAYAGQLILQGIPPYKLAYNMKLPGTYACYALVMAIFGESEVGIRTGLMLFNAGAIVLMFLLVRRFFGRPLAVIGSAVFALVSLSPSVLGLAAHATQFVIFFALAGILVLLRAMESQRALTFFCSGILLGLAFLMKQPGLVYTFFAGFWILWRDVTERRLVWRNTAKKLASLSCGVMLPFALTCLVLAFVGVFEKFWFWTFSYARTYGTIMPWKLGMRWLTDYFRLDAGTSWPFWILAAVGVIVSITQKTARRNAVFFLAFFLFSFAGVSAGLYFRPHYFLLVLPALTLLVCAAMDGLQSALQRFASRPLVRVLPVCGFITIWGWVLFQNRLSLFIESNDGIPYYLYHGNPFKEAVQVGNYIKEHSNPSDTVAVFGSEPQIYFYSQRHSASGYIYTYPLTEPHAYATTMQQEMIREIEAAKPRFIVAMKVQFSWGNVPRKGQPLTSWMNDYVEQNYRRVLLLPVEETDTTANMNPQTEGSFVYVFERNPHQ